MKFKQTACGIAASFLLSAQAYQPLEAALLPLKERLSALAQDQLRLDEQLSRADSSAEARALAWRRSKVLAVEREQLEAEVRQTRLQAQSPLLMHLAPARAELNPETQQGAKP